LERGTDNVEGKNTSKIEAVLLNRKRGPVQVETLRKLKIDQFVMPYNKHDRYQKDFARWVNMKGNFKTVKWSEYRLDKKKNG